MTHPFFIKSTAGLLAAAMLTACAHSPMAGKAPGKAKMAASEMAASEIAVTYKRPNLVVSDIERSISLYADLLGFAPGEIETSSADSFSYPVFNIPKDAKIRFVTFDDVQDSRAFALTEVSGMALPKLPSRPHMTAHVMGVTDLPGKIETIKALGMDTSPSKTVQGTEFSFIEQAFTDYDGHLIVLYEILGK